MVNRTIMETRFYEYTGTLFIPRPTQPFVPLLSLRIR